MMIAMMTIRTTTGCCGSRLTAGIFIAGFLLIHRVIHSPFGQILKAIRENEPRATSLGYRTSTYKLVATKQ